MSGRKLSGIEAFRAEVERQRLSMLAIEGALVAFGLALLVIIGVALA